MRVQGFVTEEKGVGLKGWLTGPRRARDPAIPKLVPLDPHRIAVLPMINISPDPADAYFADGLTEELISTLSKISGLSVISRTSVMRYRGQAKAAAEIGNELAVAAILEGSVRKAGDKLRISAQLIDTRSDNHLWSETYDRDLRDIFTVQSDIATKIAGSLRLTILREDTEKITKKPTENMAAYALYLKGRHSWTERSDEAVRKGIEYLTQATREDPEFALAYSDLALCYEMLDYTGELVEERYSLTVKNAKKALELDPSLGEAHAALGLAYQRKYQWKQGREELVRAITLSPQNSNVRHWYAHSLRFAGKWEEAIKEWRNALENDPFSIPVRGALGFVLVLRGRTEEGIDLAKSAVKLNELSLYAHMVLGNAYATSELFAQTAEEARILSMLAGEMDYHYKAQAASLYALSGNKTEATRILQGLVEANKQHFVDPCFLGLVYASLGDQTKALEQLEKAVPLESSWTPYINVFPGWRPVRDNPKFGDIVKRIRIS